MLFSSWFKRPLFILFLLAFLIRGAAVLLKMDSFDADPDQYRALAENLREYNVFGYGETPTAFRPPLYPMLLRAVYTLTPSASRAGSTPFYLLSEQSAAALLHWTLGILTVLFVYKLALILNFPRRWAFAAALLTAVDPILLAQSRVVMTETLAAFLAVSLVWVLTLAMKPWEKKIYPFLAVGVLAGTAALCRPVFLVYGLLVLLGLLNYTRMRKLPVRFPFAFLIGFMAVVLIWGARNQLKMGNFILSTTHGGYTLLLANNHSLYNYDRDPGPFAGPWKADALEEEWEAIKTEDIEEYGPKTGPEWELRQDELAYGAAHEAMSEDTQGAVIASLIRIGNLWQFLPYQTNPDEPSSQKACRYAVGIFYAVELPLALMGLLYICAPLVSLARRRLLISPYWSNWSWPVFLLIAIQLPHLIYWTNMRMRAPAMTVIPIFAVIGLRMIFVRKDSDPISIGGPPTPDGEEEPDSNNVSPKNSSSRRDTERGK